MTNIGNLYRSGHGVLVDESLAVEWYTRAARLGDEVSRTILHNKGLAW